MIANIILTVVLGLFGVMNFVQTAKLVQKRDWSPAKTRFYFACDSLFAILVAATIVVIWVVRQV